MQQETHPTLNEILSSATLEDIMSTFVSPHNAVDENTTLRSRYESMLRSLLTALIDLRNAGVLKLTQHTISEYLPLDKMVLLEKDANVSELGRMELKRYFDALPGFRAGSQESAAEMHGYLTMQHSQISH